LAPKVGSVTFFVMQPIFFVDENLNIEKYKKLFKERWIEMSDKEIYQIIENIDNIWNLLFDKYLQVIKDYEN
jgi:hypothetical protein